jgi:hypothetical protein
MLIYDINTLKAEVFRCYQQWLNSLEPSDQELFAEFRAGIRFGISDRVLILMETVCDFNATVRENANADYGAWLAGLDETQTAMWTKFRELYTGDQFQRLVVILEQQYLALSWCRWMACSFCPPRTSCNTCPLY